MIAGTSYSPAKAFVMFAREFFEALATKDYGAALRRLDSTARTWSKNELLAELTSVCGGGELCSASAFTQSASPELVETSSGYVLRHRLPVGGKWSSAQAVFEFTQKPGTEYFKAELRGFEL
jgi:hypothetical protein